MFSLDKRISSPWNATALLLFGLVDMTMTSLMIHTLCALEHMSHIHIILVVSFTLIVRANVDAVQTQSTYLYVCLSDFVLAGCVCGTLTE